MNAAKRETMVIELSITDANRIECVLGEFLAVRDKSGTPSDIYDVAAKSLRDAIVKVLNK